MSNNHRVVHLMPSGVGEVEIVWPSGERVVDGSGEKHGVRKGGCMLTIKQIKEGKKTKSVKVMDIPLGTVFEGEVVEIAIEPFPYGIYLRTDDGCTQLEPPWIMCKQYEKELTVERYKPYSKSQLMLEA